jgi:hypothetical protein
VTPESSLPSSFRDPSGFVFTSNGELLRQVDPSYREHYDRLMGSGLYEALVNDGRLIAHREVGLDRAAGENAYRVLRPERVQFISYPYEWCFSELRDAALLTLSVQRTALEHGMSLRDASAFNVAFEGGRPVLIDTLSFEVLPEGRPWVAYRQFCQHFLAPLALMSYTDVRLGQLSRVHLDGIPLDLATELLPRRARSRPSLFMHLSLHAKSQARHAADAGAAAGQKGSSRKFSENAFRGVLDSLEKAVTSLTWEPDETVWTDYYGEGRTYSPEAAGEKDRLVSEFLAAASPGVVWDLGGNTGRYSRIAVAAGARAICFDVDPSCVEANYRHVVEQKETGILPLLLDLTNPSPAIGWANRERDTLVARGPADLVMALALVHHLAIANNVPLPLLAASLREMTEWLIIEFVPKTDPQVKVLLASREDIFPAYTREGFEEAFATSFTIQRAEDVPGSQRSLYLMRGR